MKNTLRKRNTRLITGPAYSCSYFAPLHVCAFALVALWCCAALALAGPPQPTPQPVPAGSVTLAWNAGASDTNSADPLNYVLEWGTASGVYTCANNVGTALSCTVSNLTPGTNWYFAVLALDTNTALVSPFSNQTNFLPSIPPNSPVLTQLKVVAQ